MGKRCRPNRNKLPAAANAHACSNERAVRRHGPVSCSGRHLGGNLDAGGGSRRSRGPIRAAVLTLGGRRPAAPRIRQTVHLRKSVAEAVELPVKFRVVDLLMEVYVAHFEERGRREEGIGAGLVGWPDAHHLESYVHRSKFFFFGDEKTCELYCILGQREGTYSKVVCDLL